MIKNLTKALTLVIGMIGFSLTSNAQETASATAVNASATIIAPITISAGTELSFGDVVTGAAGGTVVMDPTALNRTKTGDVALSASNAGSFSSFDVTGEGTYTYSISLPASATLTHSNGTDLMTVDGFTTDKASNIGTLAAGADTFTVGATLNVAALQLSGVYTGTYDVTVAYN